MPELVVTSPMAEPKAADMGLDNGAEIAPNVTSMDRPLRIALVHTADQGGGAEASTLTLHKALRNLGHESFLYVGTKRTNTPHVFEIPRFRCFPGVLRGVQLLEQRFGWQYLYQPWFRQLDRLFPHDIDVVHYQSLWGGQYGFADVGGLPRLTRRFPSLMTLRDLWMVTGHCAYPAMGCDRWQTGCGQCPDLNLAPSIKADGTAFNWRRKQSVIQRSNLRVTTVSNWLGDVVRSSAIFAGKDVHTVYNGIDEAAYYPRDKVDVRERLGLPTNALIVMLAGQSVEGTTHQGKGAAECALQALAESDREIFLLVVGKSSQHVLQQWGRPGIAIPFQADPIRLAEYYCAADIVLVASLWETFGRIPAEAQMCGIPVAAFATGGIPEVIDDGVTGLLAPRLDSTALGRAVQTLVDHPETRIAFGTAASQRARQVFNNVTITQNYLRHYRDIIAERSVKSAPASQKNNA